jgi:hypothetical protein
MNIIIMFVWIIRFSKIFIIILIIFFTQQSDSLHCLQIYKREINLWTIYTTTLSDEEITKMKVIDLEKLCNFEIDNFFI